MFKKLKETKVMRDPIHGYIHLDLQVIKDLIDTFEFQRLRRIHQLGGTHQVYHTAEHSRFSHSLGVYEIIRRMVYDNQFISDSLSDYDKVSVQIAALLHDIGHGPFSHAFEHISNVEHEKFTVRIILEDTRINQILTNVHHELAQKVASIINHTHDNTLLSQIISGQLDADRMDYLLRDSYFTGTSYGNFDLERVLRSLRVHNGKLVVKESGIHTIEDYIMSRYHMYWQVYYHPLSRCYEEMIGLLFKRLRFLYINNQEEATKYPMFIPFINGEDIKTVDYIACDEPAAFYGITLMKKSTDGVLRDLASRILERDLFEVENYVDKKTAQERQNQVQQSGFDVNYYFATDETKQIPYKPYADSEPIIVLRSDNKTSAELSECSNIVAAIVKGDVKDDKKMYYPKEILKFEK